MLRRFALLAACLALVPGLSACGSSDEDKVKATVNELYAGFADRDAQKVCDSLSATQRAQIAKGTGQFKGKSCRQVMGLALGFIGSALKDAKKAKVTKVQVKGNKARATVSFKGRNGALGLTKQGGDWKISDFNLAKL